MDNDNNETYEEGQNPFVPDSVTEEDNVGRPTIEDETDSSHDMILFSDWVDDRVIFAYNYTGNGYFELSMENEDNSEEGTTLDLFLKQFKTYEYVVSPEDGRITLISDIIRNPDFENNTDYWEINFTKGEGSYEVLEDEETEESYLQVKLNHGSECRVKQLIDFTHCDIISFSSKSNKDGTILKYNIYASPINQNSEDSSSDTDEEWMPSLVVDTKQSNSENKTFQARVFHEKGNEVYGAEIVLIPREESDCPIETILITDKVKLDSINGLIENMERCYVPYTTDDLDNLEIYKKIASGEMTTSDMAYKTMTWSKLHDKGDLKSILENKISLSDEEIESYEKDDITIINASHLSGFNSGDFVKSSELDGRIADKFVVKSHETISASTSRAGHAFIVDNLNESNLSGGKVLSANQGRILNEKIKSLEGRINNGWSNEKKIGSYISYKVNEVLRLIACVYERPNYRGFQSETGTQILEGKGTIDNMYTPAGNIVSPLIRGDITLTYTKDGEVLIHSLTRQNNIDINVQTMWHY